MKQIEKLFLFVVVAILLAANAHAGRWITRDPMEVQEHMERDPHPFLDLNPHTFLGNNPVNRVDPFGLWWWDNDLVQVGGPQLLHDIFIGNTPPPVVDPNSMLAQHGVDLSVTGGQLPGNFIASQAGEVGKNSLVAMSMITPIGEGGAAYDALQAARLAKAARCEQAIGKTAFTLSKEALRRMAERGVTENMVRTALEKGTRYWDTKNKVFNYVLPGGFASGKDLLVGVNAVTGKITTVIRGTDLVVPRFVPAP